MASLEERIQQEQEKLKSLKAQLSKQQRRDETRRKIIYGAALAKLLEDNPGSKGDRLRQALEERVTRPADRRFLGLKPLRRPSAGDGKAAEDQP